MQTIGERLEEARKKKGISIREAAEATKIRGDYLSRFESNQFDIGLTELYVRGFLRTYAQFLRVPSDRILNDYASLGRSEKKSRQPSREIYGKMEVSISSPESGPAPAQVAADESAPAPASPPSRRVPHAPRRSANADTPSVDPALVFKGVKWAAAVVVALLVLWGAIALYRSGTDRGSRAAATATQQAAQSAPTSATATITPPLAPSSEQVTLIALDTVRVTVERKNPDASHGDMLFQGTLVRGQTQIVTKPGPIFITASAAENLEIEYHGKRYPTGYTGYKALQMQ